MKTVTIVTAYYKFKSKQLPEIYEKWISNMLPYIHTPMVIFVDAESRGIVEKYRHPHLTKIIEIPKEQWYTYQFLDKWKEHYKMDHEKYHTIELYMIWNEKSKFVQRVIQENPFSSDYFVWCDIGCFRRPHLMHKYAQWPSYEKLKTLSENKVMLLQVEPFKRAEIQIDSNGLTPSLQFVNRIGGTLFGGSKEALQKWDTKYYETLDLFFKNDRFAGKDQSIMATTAIKNTDLVKFILAPQKLKLDDLWFHFQDLWSNFKPLKFCFIGPGFMPIPPKGWGACEILIWDYACLLKKYGHQVTIINDKNPNNIREQVKKEQPDVVHIQYDDYGYLASQMSFFCKIVLLTTHYAYIEQPQRWGGWERIFDFAKKLPGNGYLFALSEGIQKVYIEKGIKESKIFVSHNGARADLFHYTEQPTKRDRSIFVGKIEARKRQYLLKDDDSVDFVGNIQNQYSLRNYLGEWDKEALYKNLTEYANLILLSDGEADPLVVKEALIAGLGVVVSEVSAANLDTTLPFITVVSEQDIKNKEALSDIIRKNRVRSIQHRKEIREYALKHFSWENVIVEQYLPKVQKLLL